MRTEDIPEEGTVELEELLLEFISKLDFIPDPISKPVKLVTGVFVVISKDVVFD